jgi:curved DNA-binding protein CbpA
MDGRRARNVLGVAKSAGPDEIRRAFRARALVTHPDHGGDRVAFRELVDAFELLRSADSRRPAVVHELPAMRRRVDAYDSAARPQSIRDFADVLRAAINTLQ